MSQGLKEQTSKEKEVQKHWLSRVLEVFWETTQYFGEQTGPVAGLIFAEDERERKKLEQEQERIRLEQARKRQEQRRSNQELFGTDEGRQKLKADPVAAGKALSAVDPEWLKTIDLDAIFGEAKDDVLAEAMLAIAQKNSKRGDWDGQADPALFSLLAAKVPPEKWNDTVTRKRGLGPRVCAGLWVNGNYDQICKLIELGVDTTLAANTEGVRGGSGFYSGFVQPIQHLIQGSLREIAKLGTKDASNWDADRKTKAEGAQKIFQALEKKDNAATLTKWSDVKDSELVKQFENDGSPGTIWGFENIRLPYVQAAHEAPQGVQPLRMMELWEAVSQSLDKNAYVQLIDNPEATIKKFVDRAVQEIESWIDTKEKFAEVKRDKATYIKNFRQDATAFLTEFAAQLPKGTFIRDSLDTAGQSRQKVAGNPDSSPIRVSDVAGVHWDKFMTGFACKAGLWWAKKEEKPVYYCLDGINMDDVTDYKTVKNKAIQAFLDAGGTQSNTMPHQEVITLVEVREILKNWDELKDSKGQDIVKFVEKGKILKDEELKQKLRTWQEAMEKSNKSAGRAPAPPRANFTKELNALDPALIGKLQDGKEGDKDARDIVKKSGYLLKVAKTRPEIVLKYILSRCGVLIQYGLIPKELPEAARALRSAQEEKEIKEASKQLLAEIEKCHDKFKKPLKDALVRHPLIAQGGKI